MIPTYKICPSLDVIIPVLTGHIRRIFLTSGLRRHSDFLCGLPAALPHVSVDINTPISPADRLRILYAYVTSTPADSGLGIVPQSPEWDLVESVMVLHDHDFNAQIRSWSTHQTGPIPLKMIREHVSLILSPSLHVTSCCSPSSAIPSPYTFPSSHAIRKP